MHEDARHQVLSSRFRAYCGFSGFSFCFGFSFSGFAAGLGFSTGFFGSAFIGAGCGRCCGADRVSAAGGVRSGFERSLGAGVDGRVGSCFAFGWLAAGRVGSARFGSGRTGALLFGSLALGSVRFGSALFGSLLPGSLAGSLGVVSGRAASARLFGFGVASGFGSARFGSGRVSEAGRTALFSGCAAGLAAG